MKRLKEVTQRDESSAMTRIVLRPHRTAAARPLQVLVLLLSVLAGLLVTAGPASAATADAYAEQRILDLLNHERTSRGLAPLRPIGDITDVARRHTHWMADNRVLQHNGNLSREVVGWTVLAENVGYSGNPESLHSALMNSAGHRANILDGRVTQIGIGGARDSRGTLWITQVFRRPDASTANLPTLSTAVAPATPDVAVPWRGALYVADRAPDGSTNVRTLTDSGFTPGIGLLGGVSTSAPAITTSGDGSAAVAIRGRDGAIYMRQSPGGGIWHPWFSLGGVFSSRPALASWGPGRLDVVVRGMDGNTYHRAQTSPGRWTPWQPLDGWVAEGAEPAIVATGPGQFTVAIQGRDGQIWARSYANGGWWGGWGPLAGWSKGAPSLASPAPGQYVVSIKGRDDALYTNTIANHRLGAWQYHGGVLKGTPKSAGSGGRLDVAILGRDNLLYRKTAVNGAWSPWRRA